MFEQFKQDDVEKMIQAQAVIVRTLMPLIEAGTHPLILVFALTRCLRVLLRKTSRDEQAQVRPLLYAFIAGATEAPGNKVATTGRSALWTPDQN